MSEKRFLTYDQAVSLLPVGDSIHTFYNPGFGLIGADWSREDILDKLRKSDAIELTGEQARSFGHGMCAYNKDAMRQGDILFIETDAEKLDRMDRKEEE